MTILKLVLLLAWPVLLVAQPVIDLASHVVTAGDLAPEVAAFSTADPTTILAKAPVPGAVRRVNLLQLQRWASTLGVSADGENLPDLIVLRRVVRALTQTEIVSAITESLATSRSIHSDLITVDVLGPVGASIPAGQVTVECLCARLELNAPTPLRIRWKEPGGRSGIEVIQGVVSIHGEWLEASRDLRTNSALQPGDLITRTGDIPELDTYPLSIQLDGSQTLIRSINRGQPLSGNMLRTIPVVSRGDLLELRFDSDSVRLRTAGRAEESGSIGEVLSFRNIATGQRLTARVTDAQTAQVEALHAAR